ncbi:hypothetical protein D3C78_1519890 [compost metagenome]
MVGIDDIRTLCHEQPIHQGRRSKAGVVQHPLDRRLIVIGVQRHARDMHSVNHLALQRLDAVAGVNLAARVVRKAGNDFDFEPLAHQFASEDHSFERWFWVKPLRQQQDARGLLGWTGIRHQFSISSTPRDSRSLCSCG